MALVALVALVTHHHNTIIMAKLKQDPIEKMLGILSRAKIGSEDQGDPLSLAKIGNLPNLAGKREDGVDSTGAISKMIQMSLYPEKSAMQRATSDYFGSPNAVDAPEIHAPKSGAIPLEKAVLPSEKPQQKKNDSKSLLEKGGNIALRGLDLAGTLFTAGIYPSLKHVYRTNVEREESEATKRGAELVTERFNATGDDDPSSIEPFLKEAMGEDEYKKAYIPAIVDHLYKATQQYQQYDLSKIKNKAEKSRLIDEIDEDAFYNNTVGTALDENQRVMKGADYKNMGHDAVVEIAKNSGIDILPSYNRSKGGNNLYKFRSDADAVKLMAILQATEKRDPLNPSIVHKFNMSRVNKMFDVDLNKSLQLETAATNAEANLKRARAYLRSLGEKEVKDMTSNLLAFANGIKDVQELVDVENPLFGKLSKPTLDMIKRQSIDGAAITRAQLVGVLAGISKRDPKNINDIAALFALTGYDKASVTQSNTRDRISEQSKETLKKEFIEDVTKAIRDNKSKAVIEAIKAEYRAYGLDDGDMEAAVSKSQTAKKITPLTK